ncbi:hypothetical protein [Paractinoplanes durhamensis]|uniref:CopG family transcriptional regulator n=1 Tax=Paractinoplanes durhamensis TaxID=113563 RepID=A0ABQ3YZ70_9ACTN|nr:hypothetical protein [Actinoplanes durhamensis]GIE02579.1 hypothetical protein Adu01nite_39290 [Actinoplanes durhamensis]
MTTTPRSIRFDDAVLARLRHQASTEVGNNVSALAHRLVDEGLRMAEHPGIVFKPGPSGRRAALAYGPDVWEVVKFLREIDERGPAALVAAAETFAVDVGRITSAVSYYSDYSTEIEGEIEAAEEASTRAERAWTVQSRLIA